MPRARIVALIAVALAGCAGRLENEERFLGCTTERVEEIFAARCATCHGTDMPQAGLDLVSPPMAQRLLDMPSAADGECGGRAVISSAGDHLLVDKLLSSPPCGDRMPLDGSLTAEERDCILRWSDELAAEAP